MRKPKHEGTIEAFRAYFKAATEKNENASIDKLISELAGRVSVLKYSKTVDVLTNAATYTETPSENSEIFRNRFFGSQSLKRERLTLLYRMTIDPAYPQYPGISIECPLELVKLHSKHLSALNNTVMRLAEEKGWDINKADEVMIRMLNDEAKEKSLKFQHYPELALKTKEYHSKNYPNQIDHLSELARQAMMVDPYDFEADTFEKAVQDYEKYMSQILLSFRPDPQK